MSGGKSKTPIRSDGKRYGVNIAPKKFINKSVYDAALERMHHIYSLFDHVAVAFSGGKDSTAVLNVALTVARDLGRTPLRIICVDEEIMGVQTEEYIRRVSQVPDLDFQWITAPTKHRNGLSMDEPWWYPWAPEAQDKWARPKPPEGIDNIPGYYPETPEGRHTVPDLSGLLFDPKIHGNSIQLLGLRAQESMNRTRAVARRPVDNYIVQFKGSTGKGNLASGYPVYDWAIEDIWTATRKFGWDYNHSYDLMEMAGVPRSQQRIAPAFGEQSMQGTWLFQELWPDIWDRACERVPGAQAGALYARSELYAFGDRRLYGRPPKGMNWREAIEAAIEKHPEEVRPVVALQVHKWISLHNHDTGGDPILTATHPFSGVSWPFLYKLAIRGDYKGRADPRMKVAVSGDALKRFRDAYEEEREAWLEYKSQQRNK